jgi:hypothetical protein
LAAGTDAADDDEGAAAVDDREADDDGCAADDEADADDGGLEVEPEGAPEPPALGSPAVREAGPEPVSGVPEHAASACIVASAQTTETMLDRMGRLLCGRRTGSRGVPGGARTHLESASRRHAGVVPQPPAAFAPLIR